MTSTPNNSRVQLPPYENHGEKPESFSTMYEVGPFDTTKAEHMRNLGPLVLALALRADHDREREQEDAETGPEDIDMEEEDTGIQDPLAK